MSLDHDLDNLPRLSDEDHEAIEHQYSVTPALMSEEAIAMRDAATEHAPSQPSTDDDEPKLLEQRIDDQLQALFGVMAMIEITRDSFDTEEDYSYHRVLSDAHKQLEAIGWCLGDISDDVRKLDVLAQVGQCIKSMVGVSNG